MHNITCTHPKLKWGYIKKRSWNVLWDRMWIRQHWSHESPMYPNHPLWCKWTNVLSKRAIELFSSSRAPISSIGSTFSSMVSIKPMWTMSPHSWKLWHKNLKHSPHKENESFHLRMLNLISYGLGYSIQRLKDWHEIMLANTNVCKGRSH